MASSPQIQFDNSPKLLESSPQNNLGIDKDDVYVDNTFDIQKFNEQYNDVRKRRKQKIEMSEKGKLNKLNTVEYRKQLHQLTIGELVFNFKDSMFDTLTDLLNFKFNLKNNRLFYLGILIIMIIIILYFFAPDNCKDGIKKEPKYFIFEN
jgi:hypothetical protein